MQFTYYMLVYINTKKTLNLRDSILFLFYFFLTSEWKIALPRNYAAESTSNLNELRADFHAQTHTHTHTHTLRETRT